MDGFFNFLIEDFSRPGDSFDPSLSRPYCKVCGKDAWLSWTGAYSDYCSVACRDADNNADMKKPPNSDLPLPPAKPSNAAEEAMKKLKAGVLSKLAAKDIKRKAQNLITQKQLSRQRTVARFDDDNKTKEQARDEYVNQLKQEKGEYDKLRRVLEEEAASKLGAAMLEKEALKKKLDDTKTTAENEMKNLEQTQEHQLKNAIRQQNEITRKLVDKREQDKQKYTTKLIELQKLLNEAESAAKLAEANQKLKSEATAREIAEKAKEEAVIAAKAAKTEIIKAEAKAAEDPALKLQANKLETGKMRVEKQLKESLAKLQNMSEEQERLKAENIRKLEIAKMEEEKQTLKKKLEEDKQALKKKQDEEKRALNRKKEEEQRALNEKKEEEKQALDRKTEEEKQALDRKKEEEKKSLFLSHAVFTLDLSKLGQPYCSNSICGKRVSYKDFKDLYEEEEYRIWNICSECQTEMFKSILSGILLPSAIEVNLPHSNFYELSINSPVPVAFPDFSVIWPTVKHLYEAQRFGNIRVQEEIRRCKSFDDISEIILNTPSKYIRDDWESYRFKAMRTCLFLKIDQHPRLQLLLSLTKCVPIYHQDWANEKDKIYSVSTGVSVSGLNIVGKILMEKREQLTANNLP